MRFFLDTEFIEDGRTIEPLSLGLVTEDGEGCYLVVTDTDRTLAHPWVVENVLPHLDQPPPADVRWFKGSKLACGEWLRLWVGVRTDTPEFWADYASYDWVLLCQLFGTMLDLPDGWPMFCRDVQQERHRLGTPDDWPGGDDDHNAYQDALTTRARWVALAEAPR